MSVSKSANRQYSIPSDAPPNTHAHRSVKSYPKQARGPHGDRSYHGVQGSQNGAHNVSLPCFVMVQLGSVPSRAMHGKLLCKLMEG
jgi:hypothetical protein